MCHATKVQIIYRQENCCAVCDLNRFEDGVHMSGSTGQLIFVGL
uniref:Uncharacterized protein n=1 Tax=Arundo donax TaxID=35708 RepID=A0A0A9E6L8_ARUDO